MIEKYLTDDRLVQKSENMFQISTENSIIRDALLVYGFDGIKIDEGKLILKNFKNAKAKKSVEKAEIKPKRTNSKTVYAICYKNYKKIYKLSKIAFRNNEKVTSLLSLNSPVPRTQSEFIILAQTNYEAILKSDEILEVLAKFNITKDIIESYLNSIEQFVKLHNKIKVDNVDSTITVKGKKEIRKQLETFVKDMMTILEIALDGKEEQLNKIKRF